ncbi:acyl-CoA dehydrogenase family protein [Neobacillus niacini]|uniref:acyl-CoA dehydrogenase family protein n=1 Tax=Neobacillus niacini TaxID=86668 RepID=UPI00203A5D08|nr:acyl-CoA dehydrogenase family protein [Neobacillus niacini]MCM3691089.1 acyl-CoA dehydrogenase family protein [Neobacillus niacini]
MRYVDYHNADRPFFTDDHLIFRETLQKFLEKDAVPNYEKWEEEQSIPRSFWRKMGEYGFLCSYVEEKYGGINGDFGFSIVLHEELARVGAGLFGIGTHCNVIVPYIHKIASEQQKSEYLPKCVSGEIITAIAMTEPGAGSDLASIKTTAVRDGDDYIINGQKTFISNGIYADLIIVACKTDTEVRPGHKGISLFFVESATEGFSRGRKLKKIGIHSQDTAEMYFDNVRVPAKNMLGEEGKGFYYLMEKLQQERLLCSVGAQVAAEDMLKLTIDYVKEREVFGKPVSKFQNTQFKIAEMATQIQIGRQYLDNLIIKHIQEQDIVTEVSMGKWWITDMAKRVASECIQLHGGYGYMEEYKIARRYRDIPVFSIFAGTNEIMKVIIAKNLGL